VSYSYYYHHLAGKSIKPAICSRVLALNILIRSTQAILSFNSSRFVFLWMHSLCIRVTNYCHSCPLHFGAHRHTLSPSPFVSLNAHSLALRGGRLNINPMKINSHFNVSSEALKVQMAVSRLLDTFEIFSSHCVVEYQQGSGTE